MQRQQFKNRHKIMITTIKLFKDNRFNSLTTSKSYVIKKIISRSDVAEELFKRSLTQTDVTKLSGDKRRKKLYSLSKTLKYKAVESELITKYGKPFEVQNEYVGEGVFTHDGRIPTTTLNQGINSIICGLSQLNPNTNKPIIKDWYFKQHNESN